MMTLEELKNLIEQSVPNAAVYILDPMKDGQHLQAIVISPAFAGLPLIKQHQMVMTPLRPVLAHAVHALALKTFTPEKWDKEKHLYTV